MTERKNNHPNLHWRRRMHEAADLHAGQWRAAQIADADSPLQFLPDAECQRVQDDVRAGYLAGFEAGRASTSPKDAA